MSKSPSHRKALLYAQPGFVGSAQAFQGIVIGKHEYYLAVQCQLGTAESIETALLDTGACWSIVSPELAEALQLDVSSLNADPVTISTRVGSLTCSLCRLRITFPADMGNPITVDATVAIPEDDWPGPALVIGFKGLLERISFAVTPAGSPDQPARLYFGMAVEETL